MKLIILAALTALCSAAKLDNTYLPPVSAKTAGGSELQTPLVASDELPAGSFVNEAQGVVVDAAAAGTRAASGSEESGLGGPRTSYGSTVSKVGESAFNAQIPNTFARIAPIPEHETVVGPVYGDKVYQSKTLLPQDSKDHNSNTLAYENNVESHKYNYGFHTDNGIAVGENGVAHDGSHAQGGYSYKGNDGQNYKVTYTADKGGYQPQGSHLPTPHPIPYDIVKSIEENAKDEAAGHYDDGSYDSQKYNAEGDYADTNKNHDKQGQFEKPESQPNGLVINQNSQTGSVFGFGSESTAKPQTLNVFKPGQESFQIGQGFSSGSTGAQDTFGSSIFGQNAQGIQHGASSKPQFGQSSFGSQFTQGSKPSFGFQSFGFKQESHDSGIFSTPSTNTFTQFGNQAGSTSGSKPGFPAQGSLVGKPITNSFGSSSSNFGQANSNALNGEYLPPQSTAQPLGLQYQNPQFGVTGAPALGSDALSYGSAQSSQESSASATASVSGPETGFSGLSPQVLGGLKRPSSAQSGNSAGQGQGSFKPTLLGAQQSESGLSFSQQTQEGSYSSGGSLTQDSVSGSLLSSSKPSKTESGIKPAILSTISSQSEGFESVESNKQPQNSGFQVSTQKPTIGQQSQEVDQGYKYNQPTKPFVTPSIKPQGSSFSGLSTSQLNSGSTFNQAGSGSYQPSYNGVTQAAASQFPSPSPTPVTAFPQKPFSQSPTVFGQKPSVEKEQNQFEQSSVSSVETVDQQNVPSVPTQQYTGELYQYNKPEPVSPVATPSSTPSSLNAFSQPTQSSFTQGSLTSSQFGQNSGSGNKPFSKPQFGFSQGSQSGSQFDQKTQQVTTQFGVKPQGFPTTQTQFGYKPFGTQFGTQGSKPQFGQTTQTQGSFTQTQSSQQAVGVTSTQQSAQTQPQKPFSGSQFGVFGSKPQFGQGSQVSQGSGLLQSNQQTIGSVTNTQKQTTQFGVKPQGFQSTQTQFGYKPFGTQFGVQGSKPQVSQTSQTQDNSFTQTQSTQQTVGSVTDAQKVAETQKPLSGSQFISETKPQFGQGSQISEGGSLLQSNQQTIISETNTQKETTQGALVQTGYLPPAPLSLSSSLGQGAQTSQGSSFQQSTQKTQQTVGSPTKGQAPQTQFGVQPQKPFGSIFQFGSQGSKPQFGQGTLNSQGSSFQQSTQKTQQTVGSPTKGQIFQTQFGVQPQKPFGSLSQFGSQGSKPQFGQGTQTSQGSSFQQSTQSTQQTVGSVTQGQTAQSQFGVQPQKPFGSLSQFGSQGSKPQFGQGTLTSQGSSFQQSTQTTQQTVGSVTQGQTSQTQFGVQPQKPFGSLSQFGSQESKPQFGQGAQTSQGSSFQQSIQKTQQTVGSPTKGQIFQTQFGVQPQKPFGSLSQFGSQGSKPQFGQGTQTSQGSSFQQSTQTTQQTVGSVTQGQTSQSQFGVQPQKPFGSLSQFGSQGSKPQFGQGTLTSQGSSFQQSTQTTQQTVGSVTQGQTSQSQFGVQPQKPFGSLSQFGSQGSKPQFGQGTQTSQGSSFQQSTQTTQQTVGSVTQGQTGQTQFGVQPQKPFGSLSQFGSQGSKPQFGQGAQTFQGSSFQQSTQKTQQTVGSPIKGQTTQTQFGVQPQKPFGSLSQFGSQGSRPQFGQAFQTSHLNTYQQSKFGSQTYKPLGSTFQFGAQGNKPQFGQVPATTQTGSISSLQQQSSQGSLTQFGTQTSKPFGTQIGAQETKPQFGKVQQTTQGSTFTQSQATQAIDTSQNQPALGSQSQFGTQSYKPFSSQSQFGIQETKPQVNQVQTTQQTVDSLTQQKNKPQNGYLPPKLLNPTTQIGIQSNKPLFGQAPSSQGSAFQQSTQITQLTVGSSQNKPDSGAEGLLGSKPLSPISITTQLGVQETKPQESSLTQTQKVEQSESTLTQQQSSEGSSTFGSQTSKPVETAPQIGVTGTKPQFGLVQQTSQGSSFTQTQKPQQTVGSIPVTQQQQGSHVHFGSHTYKPFGSSQISAQGTKPQFGQVTQTAQKNTFTQSQFTQQSSYNKPNEPKPFISSSPAPFTTAFEKQPAKTQYGSTSQSTQGSTTSTGSSTSQFGQSVSQGSSLFGSQTAKPFSTSHHQESKPQYGSPSYGQSSPTYTPFTNTQHSQTQFGSQYKPFGSSQLNNYGKYQFKPQFGQTTFTGYPGFGTSQASSSASAGQQPFRGTHFGSQPYRPFGSTFSQPIKSQFGQQSSFASAFASSSPGLPELVPGTKFTVQPSTVLPTLQPEFSQSTASSFGQEVSGSPSTSLASAQSSDISAPKPLSSSLSQGPAVQPLASKPNFGFSKPCCQSQLSQSTTQATPSYGISSTTPGFVSTPSSQSPPDVTVVPGVAQKIEEFEGPKQPQKFDEKTGYYY